MTDFVLVPARDYIAELLLAAPRFAASARYLALDSEDRSSAYIVFGAFRRFLEASLSDRAVVDECIRAIEYFAVGSDTEAHNLLIVEVFHYLDAPERVLNFLLPASRALYDQWP